MIINQRRIGNSLQAKRTWAVAKWKRLATDGQRDRERDLETAKLPTWLCGAVSIPSAPATTSTATPISVVGRQKHKHETKHFVRLACKIVFVVVSYCCPALWLLLAKNWLRPGQNSWSCSWCRVQVSVCPLEMPPSGNFIKLFALNSQIQFEKNNEQIVVAVVACCFCSSCCCFLLTIGLWSTCVHANRRSHSIWATHAKQSGESVGHAPCCALPSHACQGISHRCINR